MRVLVEDKALLLSLEDVKAVGDEIDFRRCMGKLCAYGGGKGAIVFCFG